jgi:hypothetical protein
MTTNYGQKSSFSATDANLRINIEDLITRYEDYKFPILKRLNGNIFKKDILSHKYEWTEQDLRPVKGLVVNQITAAGASVAVDQEGVFKTDDVAMNPRTLEKVLVTAQAGAGTLLTIERGFEGTLAAVMIEGDTLVRVGTAAPEGAKSGESNTLNGDDLYNYTQIFKDIVFMSDGQHKGFIRGDETQTQAVQRVQQELMEGLASSLLIGSRSRNAAQKRSTLGGVKYMVDTYAPDNVVDFGGAGTWSSDVNALNKIEDAVQTLALKMGGKPTVYASYKALRKVRLLQDDTLRTTRDDKKRGIGVVDTLMTGMGELDIVQVIDRTGIMDNYIFLMDESKVGYKPRKGRGWFTEEKPFDGDGHKWQVLGEYTLKAETPKSSLAYIKTLGL